MPNYTYALCSDAVAALSARLYDPTAQQWTPEELRKYVIEALRTFNAFTSFWRAEFVFDLQQGVNWYDITDGTSFPNTLRPFTVTDQELVNLIEYHLLEPLTSLTPTDLSPALWTGSRQFDLDDIYGALTRRQNETLGATGCTITRQPVTAPIARTGIVLSDSTIDIRRVAWLPVAGLGFDTQILRQTDAWAKRAFDYNYTTQAPAPPQTWLQNSQPPPRFDVDRVPPVPGTYEVLTVNGGPTSNATSAQPMQVPDDWSWVPKWGAMGDLLGRESNAKDPLRADYCVKRYEQALRLMAQSPAALALQLNGLPVSIDAVTNGDNFNPSWESIVQGSPEVCYAAGLNLLGFRTPDAGLYSALLSVVQNAPVPAMQTSYIQTSKEDYDSIIDYAQHLAAFKSGGAEFISTMPLFQKFMERCALYNAKLKTEGQFQREMYRLSRREEERNPRVEVS